MHKSKSKSKSKIKNKNKNKNNNYNNKKRTKTTEKKVKKDIETKNIFRHIFLKPLFATDMCKSLSAWRCGKFSLNYLWYEVSF